MSAILRANIAQFSLLFDVLSKNLRTFAVRKSERSRNPVNYLALSLNYTVHYMATQKKTADVDYSMQEKILALYELQKIDSKIDQINKVKG